MSCFSGGVEREEMQELRGLGEAGMATMCVWGKLVELQFTGQERSVVQVVKAAAGDQHRRRCKSRVTWISCVSNLDYKEIESGNKRKFTS